MLKEKHSTEDKILSVKLTTGEEIICELVEIQMDQMKVRRPLSLVLAEMPGAPQQTQVVFTPWMLALAEDGIAAIERSHVVCWAPAKKDASDQYVAATRP